MTMPWPSVCMHLVRRRSPVADDVVASDTNAHDYGDRIHCNRITHPGMFSG